MNPFAPGSLQGRVAIVTGGTRGLGLEMVRWLAGDGAHVVAVYASDHATAAAAADGCRAEGLSVEVLCGDVADGDECRRLVEAVVADHGRIDHLINNAGVERDGRFRTMPVEDWDEVIRVNLTGAFSMTQAVMPGMVAQGFGRIVFISSVAAVMGGHYKANYAAAKAGLTGLSRSVARDGARHGVTANCLVVGSTDSGRLYGDSDPTILAPIVAALPLGRLGHAAEVAYAVRFLVDEMASLVTGADVVVDGGQTL